MPRFPSVPWGRVLSTVSCFGSGFSGFVYAANASRSIWHIVSVLFAWLGEVGQTALLEHRKHQGWPCSKGFWREFEQRVDSKASSSTSGPWISQNLGHLTPQDGEGACQLPVPAGKMALRCPCHVREEQSWEGETARGIDQNGEEEAGILCG